MVGGAGVCDGESRDRMTHPCVALALYELIGQGLLVNDQLWLFVLQHALRAREEIMEVLLIVLTVIAAGAALVYFMGSPKGMQFVHKKSVSTILSDVTARQSVAPQAPLDEIYYSLAEERNNKSKWLADFNYLYVLRDAGCFDPRTAPQPEQFAELMASVEEKIRLHASGVAK
jgi:hypothetical protein